MKVLAVGDSYMPAAYFERALAPVVGRHEVSYLQVDPDRQFVMRTPSELGLKEFQGDPAEVAAAMSGVEVLLVQGAPVTDQVVGASGALRLVGCARGGPVNVDRNALSERKIPLVTTPGKNAEAVADLTLAFAVMLARGLPAAERFLAGGGQLRDNWEGARFIGHDLRGQVLGLVGFGQVGRRVAIRAAAFGLRVLVHDPFVDLGADSPLEQVRELGELLARSDLISLHARASRDNHHLIGAEQLARMRRGAYLINTARESLVDENALDDALSSGHLGGAALDVVEPQPLGGVHRLFNHPNVVMTPHLGGATVETLDQGAKMLVEELVRLESGKPLRHLANPEVVGT